MAAIDLHIGAGARTEVEERLSLTVVVRLPRVWIITSVERNCVAIVYHSRTEYCPPCAPLWLIISIRTCTSCAMFSKSTDVPPRITVTIETVVRTIQYTAGTTFFGILPSVAQFREESISHTLSYCRKIGFFAVHRITVPKEETATNFTLAENMSLSVINVNSVRW